MFIKNKRGTTLINLNRVDGIKTDSMNDDVSDIVIFNYGIATVGAPLIESKKNIGRYSKTQAQQIIGEIYQAMEQGESVYILPEVNNA